MIKFFLGGMVASCIAQWLTLGTDIWNYAFGLWVFCFIGFVISLSLHK